MTEPNPRMDAEASTCLRFGVLLLAAGASGYRVIRAVKRCAHRGGQFPLSPLGPLRIDVRRRSRLCRVRRAQPVRLRDSSARVRNGDAGAACTHSAAPCASLRAGDHCGDHADRLNGGDALRHPRSDARRGAEPRLALLAAGVRAYLAAFCAALLNALSRFTEVSFVVLFIAGGLSFGRMLTDPNWAFSRYIDFRHQLVGEERPINN